MDENKGYKNKTEDLSFTDSWKQNTVEMALLGSLIVGAGRFGVKGDFGDVANYSKKTLNQAGKGFERYINKKMSPAARVVKDSLKKTVGKLKNEKVDSAQSFNEMKGKVNLAYQNLDNKKIEEAAAKRLTGQMNQKFISHQINNPGKPFTYKPNFEKIVEEVKAEEVEKKIGILNERNKRKDKKPGVFVNWQENLVGSALTGAGFGAGITALHSADRMIRKKDNSKQREDSFNASGSILKERKGEKNMQKKAGTREFYDGIVDLGKRTPQAVATSLGFTGVSLATGKAIQNKNQQKKEEEAASPTSPRIIIELGQDDPTSRADAEHAYAGSPYAKMPRVANAVDDNLTKLAGLVKMDRVKEFGQNFGGRSTETRKLNSRINEETSNYRDEAAELLKNQDMNQALKNRYGNLAQSQGNQDFFSRELLDSTAKGLKRKDQEKLDAIKDDVARDRLLAMGGLAGLGGLGVATNQFLSKKEGE